MHRNHQDHELKQELKLLHKFMLPNPIKLYIGSCKILSFPISLLISQQSYTIISIIFDQGTMMRGKLTEYCNTKPAKSCLGIDKAPRRSSRVKVIPIPSIVIVRPAMVQLGVTQLKVLGLISPNKHPRETHIGNAVDTASPTNSTHSPKLFFFSVGKSFDEMLQRGTKSNRRLHEIGTVDWVLREISRLEEEQESLEQEISRFGVSLDLWSSEFDFVGVAPFKREREIADAMFFSPAIPLSDRTDEEETKTCTHVLSRAFFN